MFKTFIASAAIVFSFAAVGNATTIHHKVYEVDALAPFTIGAGNIYQAHYDGYESVTYRFKAKDHKSAAAGLIFASDDKSNISFGDYAGSWTVWVLDKTDTVKISFGKPFDGWLTFKGFLGKTKVDVVDYVLAPVEAPAPVPLPAAGFLTMAGLGALAMLRRRKAAV